MFVLRVDTSKARSRDQKNPMEPPWFLQITGVKLYTKIMHNRAF